MLLCAYSLFECSWLLPNRAQHQQSRGSLLVIENIHTSWLRYRTLYDFSPRKYYVRSSHPSARMKPLRVGLWAGGCDQPSWPAERERERERKC